MRSTIKKFFGNFGNHTGKNLCLPGGIRPRERNIKPDRKVIRSNGWKIMLPEKNIMSPGNKDWAY